MFPDRVGRLVLDGVVDADHYVAPIWLESQRDADKVWSSFFKYCHEAKSACQFYRENDKVTDIEERFESFMERLKENPISVISKDVLAPFLVTYSDVKYQIFLMLYAPLYGFRAAAELLDALERNGEDWFDFIPTHPSYDLGLVLTRSNHSTTHTLRLRACSKTWKPNHNSADPVTPLFAGVKMATKFVDAGFFEQESKEHCTIAVKSRCTIEKVRAYFREGKVPDAPRLKGNGSDLLDGEWEKCPADEWPWHEYQPSARVASEVEAAELERLDAWGGIREAFAQIDLWVRGS
ncbi:uncharacterized protein EAF02_010487 [Botrytis sinoallii]|uniref:uncharacterized protein n=1 Tax=Botrytis sinoallii TaxID=1463999 RepID=UPI0018FF2494|nr:uncharacterized protein EAF02_010487 [Botrytis sinoallii]KAF7862938.1 hypothetical protein EAF02_010487 [Botrytis sinoallii]